MPVPSPGENVPLVTSPDELVSDEHGVVGARDVPALVHTESPKAARKPLFLLAEQRRTTPELTLVHGDGPREARLERG